MKEEIINLSGVIEYKELNDTEVEICIRKQTRYNFEVARRDNGRTYVLGSCNCVQQGMSWSGNIVLYLKGREDSSRRNVRISINKEHWAVFKKMLMEEGFDVIDADNPIEAPVSADEGSKIKFEYTSEEPTEDEINKMIAQVDLNTFTSIIKARMRQDGACGEKLGKINRTWAKEYLKQWAKAKYRLYKLLGNKLKVEKDVEVEPELSYFATAKDELKAKFPLLRPVFENMSAKILRDNEIKISEIFDEVFLDKRVSIGMSFTKFIALYNCDELNVEVSKIYQNKGIAHLTISIDPNDYLTVSINSSGWRSCHNFIDGEWRNAGLSYMVDDVSMVSYKSNGDVKYRINDINFVWNSKKLATNDIYF